MAAPQLPLIDLEVCCLESVIGTGYCNLEVTGRIKSLLEHYSPHVAATGLGGQVGGLITMDGLVVQRMNICDVMFRMVTTS